MSRHAPTHKHVQLQTPPPSLSLPPTLHDHPRTNLVPWKVAINRAARAVFAEWDDFGFLFGVCDDAVWAVLNTPPGGQLRDRPEFPVPAALQAGANPAARDVFKRDTDSRAAWLACSASFCAAILESIGEANRLAISDPATDTLHLSPRDIIIAMTVLHGEMTGAEVDALRLPLRKKLTAIADLPSHIGRTEEPLAGSHRWPSSSCARCVPVVTCYPLPLPRVPTVYFIVYCSTRGNCAANV